MTTLTASQWRSIEDASIYVTNTEHPIGRYVGLGTLKNILRKSRRTLSQNAALWAIYEDILGQGGEVLGGWTKEDLHTYLLGEWSGWEELKGLGARPRLKPLKRSSRLTKLEFSDYLQFIVQRMAEHGIVVELPGESDGSRVHAVGF